MADKTNQPSRRRFLATSAVAAGAASLAAMPFVHAGGNDILRVGLIGCGGRGTGAAGQALRADPNVRLTAMGDAFQDRLTSSLERLRRDQAIGDKVDVPRERQYVGFNAYQQVINSGVDVVVLTTPPHFRPAHLWAAVRANKHVFAEKPIAVDGPGVRDVLAACREAQRRRLSVVSGLCWRYHDVMRETMRRVHDRAVGDVVAMHTSYNTGFLWHRARQPDWSDMEWQMRNWLYFAWLSGDHNVEQHVHSLDKMAWAMQDQYPVRCVGTGGRQVRTDAAFGHIFDHHAVVYEFESGAKCFSFCRQQARCHNDVSDQIMGTMGTCNIDAMRVRVNISGRNPWQSRAADARRSNMYQAEHNELFAAIRNNRPINNGEYMAKSTLMGIMGRMSTYTGQVITWDQALNSQVRLGPTRYEWSDLEVPPVPMPGQNEG